MVLFLKKLVSNSNRTKIQELLFMPQVFMCCTLEKSERGEDSVCPSSVFRGRDFVRGSQQPEFHTGQEVDQQPQSLTSQKWDILQDILSRVKLGRKYLRKFSKERSVPVSSDGREGEKIMAQKNSLNKEANGCEELRHRVVRKKIKL